ncbi:MAG: hypothetical protein ABW199_01015 [Caulobacterales bacterium]
MNGFKIMLGAIGVQVAVMGLIALLQGLHVFSGSQLGGANALITGAVMIAIGAGLASWPILTGLSRDLAGAVSIFFLVFGCVWGLQGINVLPGSFMSGDITWTYIGVVWIAIAIGLFAFAIRKPRSGA